MCFTVFSNLEHVLTCIIAHLPHICLLFPFQYFVCYLLAIIICMLIWIYCVCERLPVAIEFIAMQMGIVIFPKCLASFKQH